MCCRKIRMDRLSWGQVLIGALELRLRLLLKMLLLGDGWVESLLLALRLGYLHPSMFFTHSLIQLYKGVRGGEFGMLLVEATQPCHWCESLDKLDDIVSELFFE